MTIRGNSIHWNWPWLKVSVIFIRKYFVEYNRGTQIGRYLSTQIISHFPVTIMFTLSPGSLFLMCNDQKEIFNAQFLVALSLLQDKRSWSPAYQNTTINAGIIFNASLFNRSLNNNSKYSSDLSIEYAKILNPVDRIYLPTFLNKRIYW